MSELYLVAHKVRGEPAFDIAVQMECPICEGRSWVANADSCEAFACHECDSTGYWWIIPTSGHRAYPYWEEALATLGTMFGQSLGSVGEMPEGLPDHYPTASTSRPSLDLAQLIPPVKIQRRF